MAPSPVDLDLDGGVLRAAHPLTIQWGEDDLQAVAPAVSQTWQVFQRSSRIWVPGPHPSGPPTHWLVSLAVRSSWAVLASV